MRMTYRDKGLQADIAARRIAARRRATTERDAMASSSSSWLLWLGGLAVAAVGYLSLV